MTCCAPRSISWILRCARARAASSPSLRFCISTFEPRGALLRVILHLSKGPRTRVHDVCYNTLRSCTCCTADRASSESRVQRSRRLLHGAPGRPCACPHRLRCVAGPARHTELRGTCRHTKAAPITIPPATVMRQSGISLKQEPSLMPSPSCLPRRSTAPVVRARARAACPRNTVNVIRPEKEPHKWRRRSRWRATPLHSRLTAHPILLAANSQQTDLAAAAPFPSSAALSRC